MRLVKKVRSKSLQKQILLNLWIALLPMTLLLLLTLGTMYRFYRQYDGIVRNITMANAYNISFKKDLDESMYQIVIGSVNWNDNSERASLGSKNPYTQITMARRQFEKLKDRTNDRELRRQLNSILNLLKTLENRVDAIIGNVREGGHYDENIQMFNMDITILTNLIQNSVQEYIYEEATEMEDLRQEMAGHVVAFLQVMVVLVLVMMIVNIIFSRYMTRRVIRPINQMAKATEAYGRGDFSQKLPVNNRNELDVLAERFNRMGEAINNLIATNAKEQREKQSLELKLLTAEINPHFLYNTLDTIVWLTEAGENAEAVKMLSYLSDFFRVSLSNGRDIITVADEETHIRSYLGIQKMRFQDIMDYEISIEDSIKSCPIVKMTFQPLVENALYHGIRNQRKKGMIRVSGRAQKDHIIFIIQDSGRGMEPEELDAFRQRIASGRPEKESGTGGFGVANVVSRLRLYYGSSVDITVKSAPGNGTEIRIIVPKHVEKMTDL